MYGKLFISFIFFSSFLNVARCLVCLPEACASIQCKAVEGCEGPNKEVKPGGWCKCCNVCHTILGENEPCRSIVLQGVPPPTSQCGEGLICYEGKCKSFKALSQSSS